ncbi:TraX protein [compost metagenome]
MDCLGHDGARSHAIGLAGEQRPVCARSTVLSPVLFGSRDQRLSRSARRDVHSELVGISPLWCCSLRFLKSLTGWSAPSGTFNVLVTLALWLLVAWGVQPRTLESLVLAGGAILAGYLLSEPLMYGFYGVLVPAALVLAIKRPELFALLPVALCVAVNSRTSLFEQAAHLEPFAILALLTAALAPLLGLALFWARLPFKIVPVTQWSYWFYPGHLIALLGIRNLL